MAGSMPIRIPGLEIDEVAIEAETVRIVAHCVGTEARCPDCHILSSKVHSWYQRHPMDLPCIGQMVRVVVSV
jgi:hypothetical protein